MRCRIFHRLVNSEFTRLLLRLDLLRDVVHTQIPSFGDRPTPLVWLVAALEFEKINDFATDELGPNYPLISI